MAKKSGPETYWAWATSWGPMGAVAGPKGIRRVVLPHYEMDDLLALLGWEHQGATRQQEPFEPLIAASRDYFAARPADFSAVDLDLPSTGSFSGKVYRAAMDIPPGRTTSYGLLAKTIGQPDAARAVATALSKNPMPLVVPCHRITYSDGRPGGFSAPGGPELKQRMLTFEANQSP